VIAVATPVRDESVQLVPLDQMILRYIRRSAEVGSIGPCQAVLVRSLGASISAVQASLARLTYAGLIKVSAQGRYYPIIDEPPVTTLQLTPEELERVRRGEPSTGKPFGCSSFPSGVIAPLMQPPPTKVVATAQRRRRQRVSDLEIIEAIRQHGTRHEAAKAVGLSPGAFSKRAKALGMSVGRVGRPPKVSDEEILRAVRHCRTRTAAAQRLGISPKTIWYRLRRHDREAGAS